RLELRDEHDAVRILRTDDVADVDLADAGHTIDRRSQPRVAELYIRGFDERLVTLDSRLQLRDLRLLGVDQLRRGKAPAQQRRVASEIGLGILELGPIA